MKLGFVSAILPELDLKEVLSFARKSGYSCVEIMCWPPGKAERRYAGVTHIDVTNLKKDNVKKIKSTIAKSGVTVSGLGYYPNPLAPDHQEARVYIDHLREVIKAAALLDINLVNTFIGRDWNKTVDDNWPRFREVWPELIKYAADQGVKVAIENCPMAFSKDEWPGGKNLAHTPAVWRRMFEEIPLDNFGLNFDPSHLVWQHMDYLKAVREFAGRIFHVHAKDCRLDKHKLDQVGIMGFPLQFHTPKLPGLGDVDWSKFLSILGDCGYNGPVCVEVEDRVYEGTLQNRKLALQQSYNYLRPYIAE